MMRLCLLLLSCCVFGSFAKTEIDEILQAINGIRNLNLPLELRDLYLTIPKYISKTCPTEYLKICTESLEILQSECENIEFCSGVNSQFQNLLSKALGNLRIVQRDMAKCQKRRCISRGVKEVKLELFLNQFKEFLNCRNRKLC